MHIANTNMSRRGKFVVVVAVIWFVGATVYGSHRTNLTQLLTFPLIPLFLVALAISVICIFKDWRIRRWKSLFPLGACVLSLVATNIVTRWIRHALFIGSLPSYEAIVRQIESGEILVSTNHAGIPQAVPKARMAWAVYAQEDTNGVLTVEFLTETGFPVKHSGYLYSSSGTIVTGSEPDLRWPLQHEERPKWYFVSD